MGSVAYAVPRHYQRKRRRQIVFRIVFAFFSFIALLIFFSPDRGAEKDSGGALPSEPQNISETEMEGITASAAPRIVTHEEDITFWGYTGGIDSFVEKKIPRKYWGPSMRRDSEGTLDEWTATNLSCMRLHELGVSKEEMRQRYIRHRIVRNATGCDSLSVPFNPLADVQCVDFMTNSSKWKKLVPIGQSADQRTIKFFLVFDSISGQGNTFIDHPIETVIKVPQRLFPTEAASEVAAFHADRLLKINRVPPTGWACLPVHMIREAVEQYKDKVQTDKLFLSQSGVSNYADWVEKDLFDFVRDTYQLEKDARTGEACIGVSIQLKVADVGRFLSSPLRIEYESHNDTWHAFFDLNANEKHVRKFLTHLSLVGVLHLSEINMFDYVIGNMDRSPNKNNFVVGGVHLDEETGNPEMLHPNHPTAVYLDQGMSFYDRRPRRNGITNSMKAFEEGRRDTFCLFRGPLLRRIHELAQLTGGKNKQTIFTMRMKQNIPKGAYKLIGGTLIRHCTSRMRELLAMAERCLGNEIIRPYVLSP